MSLESAKLFIEKINQDAEFKSKMISLKEDKKEKWKFLNSQGFHFTGDEYQEAYISSFPSVLDDKDLEKVAGGVGGGYNQCMRIRRNGKRDALTAR